MSGKVGRQEISDDLDLLDRKLKQLKTEYDQYFLGSRPREPQLLRGEVQKIVSYYSNVSIKNTALRFRFNNLVARFFAHKRQWERVVRQIEEGTYERHLFKAGIHGGRRPGPGGKQEDAPAAAQGGDDVFAAYVAARKECGEDTAGLTRERLAQVLERQGEAIRARYGCKDVSFRVVVEGGRAKLKASASKDTKAG